MCLILGPFGVTLNYLYLSIRRKPTGLRTGIFRKPTFTDTIIPFTSKHPIQQKYAAVRYLYNRRNSYNLHQSESQDEINIIHNIQHNNTFPIKPHKPKSRNPNKQAFSHTTQKWDNFAYTGIETSYITSILKEQNSRLHFAPHTH